MPLMLSDAANLTQNMLVRGVIETLVTESAVLRYLPFMGVAGSGVSYNRELVLPGADWHAVNGPWTESAPEFDQVQTALKILGGDADVDAFLQQTYSNLNDLRAIVIQQKAKATAYAFNRTFFAGDSTLDPTQFDGLDVLAGPPAASFAGLSGTVRAFSNGANGAVLTLDAMDQLVDAIKPGKPDALFMSKRSRRKLSSLRRGSGNLLETGVDAFGQRAMFYDGIPLEVDENISDTQGQGTSGSVCSSIYAVKFGFQTGLCGLQNGTITVVDIGNLETKDAMRARIKWYVGLMLGRGIALCRLAGVKDS